ncbi:MAG: hypothetical protein FWF95_05630 [Syntrophorhabdaceae bacterium]|nr:hypothetical protein [Syntrophorhabdaceae bacterium]
MKKALTLLALLLFFWVQSVAVAHIHESDRYYEYKANCPICAFLSQCLATDLSPIIAALPSCDLQDVFTQEKSEQVIFQPCVYYYSNRAPPII